MPKENILNGGYFYENGDGKNQQFTLERPQGAKHLWFTW